MLYNFGDTFLQMYKSGRDDRHRQVVLEEQKRQADKQIQQNADQLKLAQDKFAEETIRWDEGKTDRDLARSVNQQSLKSLSRDNELFNPEDVIQTSFLNYLTPAQRKSKKTFKEWSGISDDIQSRLTAEQNSMARVAATMSKDKNIGDMEDQALIAEVEAMIQALPKNESAVVDREDPNSWFGFSKKQAVNKNLPSEFKDAATIAAKVGTLYKNRQKAVSPEAQATIANMMTEYQNIVGGYGATVQGDTDLIFKNLGTFGGYSNALRRKQEEDRYREMEDQTLKASLQGANRVIGEAKNSAEAMQVHQKYYQGQFTP